MQREVSYLSYIYTFKFLRIVTFNSAITKYFEGWKFEVIHAW